MSWQRLVAGVAVLLLILVVWLGRYTIVGGSANGAAYRLDRWTGEIVYMFGNQGGAVPIEKQ